MLSLNQRPCNLGDKYSGKKQKKSEAKTLKVELETVELSKEEVNALFGDPYAYNMFYDTSAKPIAPMLYGKIKAIELEANWKGGNVVLFYNLGVSKIELKNATLSKIKIHPTEGGTTYMSCNVEGEPPLDKNRISEIIDRIGSGIECEIHADHPEEQTELPLNSHGTGEQPDIQGPKSRGRRGRRPQAH